ncbi:hypothetical protein PYCCODRAFT_788107 [Trametes coccinea BRFM310]|uniref:Uncharacterized protein n=1 Tax=Trametes coccinea (strain BRFM310) TaxID=1353009 RepID=A0A1Y2J2J4_TRAC3|nr:hypothetical protein PYCCODRAFT_788107 [Trametes coccinea BRFM310]
MTASLALPTGSRGLPLRPQGVLRCCSVQHGTARGGCHWRSGWAAGTSRTRKDEEAVGVGGKLPVNVVRACVTVTMRGGRDRAGRVPERGSGLGYPRSQWDDRSDVMFSGCMSLFGMWKRSRLASPVRGRPRSRARVLVLLVHTCSVCVDVLTRCGFGFCEDGGDGRTARHDGGVRYVYARSLSSYSGSRRGYDGVRQVLGLQGDPSGASGLPIGSKSGRRWRRDVLLPSVLVLCAPWDVRMSRTPLATVAGLLCPSARVKRDMFGRRPALRVAIPAAGLSSDL